MADTQTTNLNLTKPEPGAAEDTWGISLNADLDTLDAIFSSSGTQINLNPNQINFAQNKKAVFGTNSDLQIYHNGSNSIIDNTGTGSLIIQDTDGTGDILIKPKSGQTAIAAYNDNTVEIAHSGNVKLATTSSGISVIGAVVATSDITSSGVITTAAHVKATGSNLKLWAAGNHVINIDSSNLYAQTDNSVDLGFSSSANRFRNLYLAGTANVGGLTVATSASDTGVDLVLNGNKTSNGGVGSIIFNNNGDSVGMIRSNRASANDAADMLFYTQATGGANTKRMQLANNGDISFYNTAGNSQALFWDASAEKLGLGTTSPDTKMHISDTTGNAIIRLERNDTTISTNDIYGEIQFEGQDASAASAAGVRGKILGVSEGTTGQMAIAFHTANSYSAAQEALRIDSSQNVNIGTASATSSSKVTIQAQGANNSDETALVLRNYSAAPYAGFVTTEYEVGTTKIAEISAQRINSTNGQLIFRTNQSGTFSDALTITNSGNVLVAGTSIGQDNSFAVANSGNITIARASGNGRTMAGFTNGGSTVGTISTTTSATAYNTSSDARLKDVTGEARGLEVINELNPVAYNWKADGKADEGLIAQEVKELVPNAVSGSEEEMYQMDYSKLVVHLVKAVKEQQTQIESLKGEIANLKGE